RTRGLCPCVRLRRLTGARAVSQVRWNPHGPYDAPRMGLVERFQALAALTRRHHRAAIAVQAIAVAVLLVALAFAVHGAWANAGERLRHADYVDFSLALAALAAY